MYGYYVPQVCLPAQLRGKTASQLNKTFIQNYSNDLSCLLVGAKAMAFLDQTCQTQAVKLATNIDKNLRNRDLDTCLAVYESLSNGELGPTGKDYKTSDSYTIDLMFFFRFGRQGDVPSGVSGHLPTVRAVPAASQPADPESH